MDKFDANKLIEERGSYRGSFVDLSNIAQGFKVVSRMKTASMTDVEREALDNIYTKIARILTRKIKYDLDSWQDIAGYATLVVNHLIKRNENENQN